MRLDQYPEDYRPPEKRSFSLSLRPDNKLTDQKSISDIFLNLTKQLQQSFDISRGLLAIRESHSTRFLAVSTFSNNKTRRNLSLRIPSVSSLFDKVAEQGQLFSENYAELFSGNSFERNLLLAPEAQAYLLLPLKHEGVVVGVIGYSSESPMAFATFEEGVLDEAAAELARLIVQDKRLNQTT